jgi:septal ring-binding cell division protein DamX
MTFRVAAAGALLLAMAALLPAPAAAGEFVVNGSVYEADTGDYVDDAQIEYEYENGSTVATSTFGGGFYEIDPTDGETVSITVSKDGYDPATLSVTVDRDIERDVDLDPNATPTPTPTPTATSTATVTATPTATAAPNTTAASEGGGGPVRESGDLTGISAGVTAIVGGAFGLWRWRS